MIDHTAADGSRKSGQVVWQRDFVIKGDDLLPESGATCVSTQMMGSDGVYYSVDPEVVSATAKKIVCHWPKEYGEGCEHGRMSVSVGRPKLEGQSDHELDDRCKYVTVYPT